MRTSSDFYYLAPGWEWEFKEWWQEAYENMRWEQANARLTTIDDIELIQTCDKGFFPDSLTAWLWLDSDWVDQNYNEASLEDERNRVADIVQWALTADTWNQIEAKHDVRRQRILDAIAYQMKDNYKLDKIAWVENLSISEDGTVVSYTYLWSPITVTLVWWNKVEHSWETILDIEYQILKKAWVERTKSGYGQEEYEISPSFSKFLWLAQRSHKICYNLFQSSIFSLWEQVPFRSISHWNLIISAYHYCRSNNLL